MIAILAAAIREDGELIDEMLAQAPEGCEAWRPDWPDTAGDPPFTLGRLAEHLVESFAGICGCLHRADPERITALAALREEAAPSGVVASRELLGRLRAAAAEGFALLTDADLERLLPSVFAPAGEPFLQLLLVNRQHLNHHAHQLFLYLKLLGVDVSTRHLYRFRATGPR